MVIGSRRVAYHPRLGIRAYHAVDTQRRMARLERDAGAGIVSTKEAKFGPLTGRLLAELAWEGKASIPEADTARRLFSLD